MNIIAGKFRGHKLISPKGNQTRPTASRLREALFNICQGCILDSRFLDLFAGSGAMGLEALSRGACQATFIDSSKEAIQCLKKNASLLKVEEQCHILQGQIVTLINWLAKQRESFDIIYADPPYKSFENEGYSEKVIELIDQCHLLKEGGRLFIEEDKRYAPQPKLSHLILKDSRLMGPSVLQQYVQTS